MFTLMNCLPWYFWFTFGIIGVPYLFRYVLKSTKNEPILIRVSWFMMAIAGIYMVIDSFIRGMRINIGSSKIMDILSLPIVVLIITLMCIGGYQKFSRPGYYNAEKRKLMILLMCSLIVGVVLMTLPIVIYYFSHGHL
jgi:uncharacterized membrane protein